MNKTHLITVFMELVKDPKYHGTARREPNPAFIYAGRLPGRSAI